MSDLFHEEVHLDFIKLILYICALSQKHTFQILTKRPKRMLSIMNSLRHGDCLGDSWARRMRKLPSAKRILEWKREGYLQFPPRNVWLGVSVEDQETADKRIPLLLKTPAAVRWISAEPLLGPIDLHQYTFQFSVCQVPKDGTTVRALRGMLHQAGKHLAQSQGTDLLDWIVVGGESGPNARQTNVEWVRSLINQASAGCVPIFVKQLGAKPVDWRSDEPEVPPYEFLPFADRKGGNINEWPVDLRIREYPEASA